MIEGIRAKNREWKYFIIMAVLLAVIMAFTDEESATNKFIMFILFDTMILLRKIRIDVSDALIVIATFSYRMITNPDPGSVMWGMVRVFALYQIAKYFVEPSREDRAEGEVICERAAFVVLILSVAFFLKGILNYSYVLTDGAFLSKEKWPLWNPKWTSLDFEREDVLYRSPEEQQFFIIMMGSLFPYFVMKLKSDKLFGIVGIIMSAAAMWIGTLSTGGLGFVCAAVATLITFIAYAAQKGAFSNLRFWVVAGAVIDAITALILIIKMNVAGTGTFVSGNIWSYSDRQFYKMRFSLMGQALSFIPQYPFGGFEKRLVIPNVRTAYFAYNSWIDTAVQGGFIPFVLYSAVLVFNIFALVFICRKIGGIAKYMLTAAFAGITTYHMLQPAFLQDRRYWYTEVFLGGLAMAIYYAVSGRKRLELSLDTAVEGVTCNGD